MGKEKSHLNLQYDRALQQQVQQQDWQHSENELDRQFQVEQWNREFQAQQDEWTRQFNLQNEYNTPSAQVARLAAAGINPVAAFQSVTGSTGDASAGGSGSLPSPTPPSSHSVSSQGLASPTGLSSDAMMFSSLAQLADSVSKLGQTGLNAQRQQALLGKEIENVSADTEQKRQQAALTETNNAIQQVFGKQKAGAEVQRLIADSYKAYADGDYQKANKLLADSQTFLNNQQGNYNDKAMPILLTNLEKLGKLYDASASERRAAAAEHGAQASYLGALTLTENALRDGKVKGLDLSNQLADLQKQMASRENVRDAATHEDKIHAIVTQCEQYGLVNDKLKAEVDRIRSENDWIAAEKFIGCMSQAIGSVTSLGQLGIKTCLA